jgi:hypothetical protein
MPLHCPHGVRFFIVAALALTALPDAGSAQAAKKANVATLEGSWNGGGTVVLASGAKEQARCRARYTPAGKNSYTLNATCAMASGRAAQTATVRRVGENRYSGRFHNSEYAISGVIHIVVRGASQTVRLISESGSAFFNLNR